MSIFDDQPDIDPDEETDYDEYMLRLLAQMRPAIEHALDEKFALLAEDEEQRQAEEAAEAHMDSPWPHRPAS